MSQLQDQIAGLSDRQAVATLALVLERQGHTVDPFAWKETEPGLRQALTQPDVTSVASTDPTATSGELARTTLTYLADHDADTGELVERAISIPPSADRFDPATLAVGALVLMAFHAEIDLKHDPDKGWTFRFHTKPLKDSTIARMLGQLIGVYTSSTPS